MTLGPLLILVGAGCKHCSARQFLTTQPPFPLLQINTLNSHVTTTRQAVSNADVNQDTTATVKTAYFVCPIQSVSQDLEWFPEVQTGKHNIQKAYKQTIYPVLLTQGLLPLLVTYLCLVWVGEFSLKLFFSSQVLTRKTPSVRSAHQTHSPMTPLQ